MKKFTVYFLVVLLIVPFVSLITLFDFSRLNELSDVLLSSLTKTTLQLFFGVIILSNVWAISAAWIVSRYNFISKLSLDWLFMLPLAIPPFVMAYTYKNMLGPFGTTHRIFDVYFNWEGLYPLMFYLSFSLFPYIYIFLKGTLRKSTGLYLNASKSLGKGALYSFFRIALPVNIKAIFAGSIIVGMEVLNNYGAVKYLGVKTYTTKILDAYNPMLPSDSFNTSVILILFVFSVLAFEKLFNRNKRFDSMDQANDFENDKPSVVKKIFVGTILIVLLLVTFAVPVSQLLSWSMQELDFIQSADFASSIQTSVVLCVLSSVVIVGIAIVIQGYSRYHDSKIFKGLKEITSLGYAIPGAVLGLGILSLVAKVSHWSGVLLTGSIGVLIYAYASRFLSIGNNSIQSGYAKIPKELSLASKNLGKSNWMSFTKIDFPLLKTSIGSALIIVFVDVMKELPLTMLFQRFNFETLAVMAFGLMETDGGVFKAAIPCLLIILIGLIPVYLINKKIK